MKKDLLECKLMSLYRFIGKTWTIPIIHCLVEGPKSFLQIEKCFSINVNNTLLSNRLKTLIKYDIIEKEKGRNGKYQISKHGDKFLEIMFQIEKWSNFIIDCNHKDKICEHLYGNKK